MFPRLFLLNKHVSFFSISIVFTVWPHATNPFMLKFPQQLVVHKGNVFFLLYVVGGLVMTVTAGGQCVDLAVKTVQDPANLLRLSNTLIRLMGLRYQIHAANSLAKRRQKRLYFTESFSSLLHMTRTTLPGTHDLKVLRRFPVSPEKQTHPESTSTYYISARRCRIYYILICGASSQPILALSIGNNSSEINTYNPSNQLQWLINFSSKAQARGDVIFLLLGGQTGQMSTRSDTNIPTNEPASLTLGLSALFVILFWTFLPYAAAFAVIFLVWKVQQHTHRVLQSKKCSL